MIDVQPGFYEGVDGYEQACRYHSETVYYEKASGIAVLWNHKSNNLLSFIANGWLNYLSLPHTANETLQQMKRSSLETPLQPPKGTSLTKQSGLFLVCPILCEVSSHSAPSMCAQASCSSQWRAALIQHSYWFSLQANRARIKTPAGPEGGSEACMCLKCHETAKRSEEDILFILISQPMC